ncbi:GTP cyclohydrolase I [Pseudoclavibacter sp. 13-3]|uniref:GTP cyclohydrolase I n=1 Tax=Pseudoclavibacter sp. 13-3 TaxID=2901228 RepID=UPI001E650A7A|nr:GTP cyclohydrolase I [Pseudoclavibacter sp. 13-3]MCD7101483.1 GTP cyclohydrolase I [Pseudoclavibacter sp. 13-3]
MVDQVAVQQAVRSFLTAVGLDPDDEVLRETPTRVAKAAAELFAGVSADPVALFEKTMPAESHDLVAMTGITVRSMCAHHLLPMYGTASIAYLPNDRIVGLSTLPHLVDLLASRPQVQETLTAQIADALMTGIDARGALVTLRLHQDCVSARGARQQDAVSITVAARGDLQEPARRLDALAALSEQATKGQCREV